MMPAELKLPSWEQGSPPAITHISKYNLFLKLNSKIRILKVFTCLPVSDARGASIVTPSYFYE